VRIRSSPGDYEVVVGEGALNAVLSGGADLLVVDRALAGALAGSGPAIFIDASEEAKTSPGASGSCWRCAPPESAAGHHVVAVGGGVVQDIATFVTDIYMRVLAWTYVPTTLMDMADSCIGGKSSINVGGVTAGGGVR
jgi:3-dehydroquinate synthase